MVPMEAEQCREGGIRHVSSPGCLRGGGDLTSYVEGDFDFIHRPCVPRRLRACGSCSFGSINLYLPCTRVSPRVFVRSLRSSGARAAICFPYHHVPSSSLTSSAELFLDHRGATYVLLPCAMSHDFRYYPDWFECFHFGALVVAVQTYPPQFSPTWDVFMYRLEPSCDLYGEARAPSRICRFPSL